MKKKNKEFILLYPFILIDSNFIMQIYKKQDIIIIPAIRERICILSFRHRPKRKLKAYDTFLLAYHTAKILLMNYNSSIFIVLQKIKILNFFHFIKNHKRKLIKILKLKPNRRENCLGFLIKNNKIFIRLLLFYLRLTGINPLIRNFKCFLLDLTSCKKILVTFKKTKELLCLFILSLNIRYEFNTYKISLFIWIYNQKGSFYIKISTYTSFHYLYNLDLTIGTRQLILFVKNTRFLSKFFKKLYMKHIEYLEEYLYIKEKETYVFGKQRVLNNACILFSINLMDYLGSPKLVFNHLGHEIFLNKNILICVNILIYMYNIEDPVEFAREKKLGYILLNHSTSYIDIKNFVLRCFDLYRKITLDSFYKEYTKNHLVLRIWRKKGIKESSVNINPFVYYKTVDIFNGLAEKDTFYLEEEAFRNEKQTIDTFDFDLITEETLTTNDYGYPI